MTGQQLVVATRNQGKLQEFERILNVLSIDVLDLHAAGVSPDVDIEETGMTFDDNARLKAVEYGRLTGLRTVADDSGLCVDALDGAPGVLSARYVPGSDEDRVQALLDALSDVPDDARTARFVCSLALYDPNEDDTHLFSGVWDGWIAHAPRGIHGFGYDPIFVVDPVDRKTSAELTPDRKNAISHRGLALLKLVEYLQSEKPIER